MELLNNQLIISPVGSAGPKYQVGEIMYGSRKGSFVILLWESVSYISGSLYCLKWTDCLAISNRRNRLEALLAGEVLN